MNSINLHIFRQYFLVSVITFLVVCIFPVCLSSSDSQWFQMCGNKFTCGNISVGFPFWGGSSRPENCGYPELELTCEDEIKTTIKMSTMKFYVLDIDQGNNLIRIARDDLSDGLCLQKFVNTTLDFSRFYGAIGSQNITILYGCPALGGDGYSGATNPGQFTCRINGSNETDGYYQSGATGPSGCYASVVVPVLASSEALLASGALGLSQAVDDGFEAHYRVQDAAFCDKCGAAKGRCGFDLSKSSVTCFCPDGSSGYTPCGISSKTSTNPGSTTHHGHKMVEVTLGCVALGLGVSVLLAFSLKRRYRIPGTRRRYSPDNQEINDFLNKYGSLATKRYTYSSLKRMTNSFNDKLGEGGYGVVYKGKLLDGHLVAVKLLKESNGNTEEFINEVSSIGSTNHVNVVKLLGFSFEGRKRALVYDFMPNGSLEKFVYEKNSYQSLAWDKLFQIAVGIARGLEYLHRGCNTRIVHFDIKPHHILLDENFCPKVSDFGLAKPCHQNDSIISMSGARGTVGFIAPEVFLKGFGGVSHKSDVYSYGMLVLDMVGCRKNVNAEVQNSSEQYFPDWIYKQLEQTEELGHQDVLIEEEKGTLRKMILVSLWCIQTNPSARPPMTRVVEMLEGPLESLQIPPTPTLFSPPISQSNSTIAAIISSSTTTQIHSEEQKKQIPQA